MINPVSLIEFDTTEPPFDKPAIRQAISLALDRKFLIDNIWFGYGKPATSALSTNFAATGLYAEGAAELSRPTRTSRPPRRCSMMPASRRTATACAPRPCST